MDKKVVQTCDCDITKEMIERGVIKISNGVILVGIIDSPLATPSPYWFCQVCGERLKIEEEKTKEQKAIDACGWCDEDGRYYPTGGIGVDSPNGIKCDHFPKENDQVIWGDLPEMDGKDWAQKINVIGDGQVAKMFADSINRIGRKVFNKEGE